ncbi:MAG: hypothetical protein ACJ8EL_21765 [Rhizomicrobium sp.]
MRAAVAGVVSLIASAAQAAAASLPPPNSSDLPPALAAHVSPALHELPVAHEPLPAREPLPAHEPPVARELPATHEPLALSDQMHFTMRRRANLPLLGPQPTPPPSPGFSIGPIRAEGFSAQMGKNGKMRFKPHYRLDGVSVLGGSIGGSLDTRGGMVTLNWHTSP